MGDETDEHPRNHGKQGIGEGGMKNGVHETTNHRTQSEHKPQQQTIFLPNRMPPIMTGMWSVVMEAI